MAIIERKIPRCDDCDEEWLPRKGKNREDPEKNVARCGKCKSPNWNAGPREQRLRGRRIRKPDLEDGKTITDAIAFEVLEEARQIKTDTARRALISDVRPGKRPKLCVHLLTDCPICGTDQGK